ncbi:RNA polymerase sigma factor [Streptomyces gamaensis]|uniref:RNA polymerase sigma factor n=1 Tax=Streptomyces gamaensis TaxID=1763542 RepID=A0ABW0Z1T8_9ACTN
MSREEPERNPDARAGQPTAQDDAAAALPVDFVAFYTLHHRTYLDYACLQLGSWSAARDTVEHVFTQLSTRWPEVLRQPHVEAYVFAAFKEELARRLPPDGKGAIAATAAMAQLPERCYDVVLLHCVLGYPQQHVADFLGVSCATVRSHVRGAHRRLARETGIDRTTETDEES